MKPVSTATNLKCSRIIALRTFAYQIEKNEVVICFSFFVTFATNSEMKIFNKIDQVNLDRSEKYSHYDFYLLQS